MDTHTGWEYLKLIYLGGSVVSAIITFLVSRDPSMKIRLLCTLLIALTWPLSLPLVLMMLLI